MNSEIKAKSEKLDASSELLLDTTLHSDQGVFRKEILYGECVAKQGRPKENSHPIGKAPFGSKT